MPIFEAEGKRYNVQDAHIAKFALKYPKATTIMERNGQKYKVKASDIDAFNTKYPEAKPTGVDYGAFGVKAPTYTGDVDMLSEGIVKAEADRVERERAAEERANKRIEMMDSPEFIQSLNSTMENTHNNLARTINQMEGVELPSQREYRAKMEQINQAERVGAITSQEANTQRMALDASQRFATTPSDAMIRKQNTTQVAELSKMLDEKIAEKEQKIAKEQAEKGESFLANGRRGGGTAAMPMYMSTGNGRFTDQEYNTLIAAKRSLDDAQKLIDEADRTLNAEDYSRASQRWHSGLARGAKDQLFDVRTWDMGVSEAIDASALNNALDKADNGEELTDAERALLDAKAYEMAVNAYFGSHLGKGYKVGVNVGAMAPFMLEMAINPLAAVGKTAQSKLVRYALKKYGKGLVQKKLKYNALKYGSRLMGDIVGSAGMTLTSSLPRTYADAVSRHIGNVKPEYAPITGEVSYGGTEGGVSAGRAAYEAIMAGTLERLSEMSSYYLTKPFKGMKLPKLDNKAVKAVSDFVQKANNTDLARLGGELAKKTQWGGVVGEYFEEVENNILNAALVGDMKFDNSEEGVFNLQNNWLTLQSVAAVGGSIATLKTGYYPIYKYKQARNLNKADAKAADAFGDEWEGIKASLNGLDEQSFANFVALGKRADVTPLQKEAAKNYFQANVNLHAAQDAAIKQLADAKTTPEEMEVSLAYDEGRALVTPEEMNEAKRELDDAANDIRNQFALGEDQDVDVFLGNTPLESIRYSRENGGSEQEAELKLRYLTAKAKYDGMLARVRDEAKGEVEASNIMIDGLVNNDMGGIVNATIASAESEQGVPVNIVSGVIVTDKDGNIDIDNTDSFLIYKDKDGSLKHISKDRLMSAQPLVDVAEYRKQLASEIVQRNENEATAQIDGILPMNVGDTFYVMDEEGLMHQAAITNALQDGSVEVSIDNAKPQQMTRDAVQAMHDAFKDAEYQEKKAKREEQERTDMQQTEAQLQKEEDEKKQAEEEAKQAEQPQTATSRVPVGENGNLLYEQADSNTAWDALVEQAKGNEATAQKIADMGVKKAQKALDEVKQSTINEDMSIEDMLEAENAHNDAVAAAEANLNKWKEIATTPQRRAEEAQRVAETEAKAESMQERIDKANETISEEQKKAEQSNPYLGRSLTSQESKTVIALMENNAQLAPELELTPENWVAEFGEDGVVSTPIGDVKMGENQYLKLLQRKRSKYFGLIKPTLTDADIILEEYDPKDGAERDTKLLFIKTFTKEDGSRYIHFESVTVQKDTKEVSISSHEINATDLQKKMHNDNVVHLKDTFLDSELRLIEPQAEGSDIVPTPNASSDNKDTTTEPQKQENSQENSASPQMRADEGVQPAGKKLSRAMNMLRIPLRKRANMWSKKVGVPAVIVEDFSDVTSQKAKANILEAASKDRRVTGWVEDGKVYLYMPNLRDIDEIDETYIHEVVAHKGMDAMLGKEEYRKFCLDVFDQVMTEADRKFYLKYEGVKEIEDEQEKKAKAADEYIAHLSESTKLTKREASMWDKIVDLFRKMLEALGYPQDISKLNIEDMIRKSYRNLLENKDAGKLEDTVIEAAQNLEENGAQVDVQRGDVRNAVRDVLSPKQKEKTIKDIMTITGRSRSTVEKWLKAEQSLAKIILDDDNEAFLDLQVDESVPSIWNNSDYPQGTVEFSNICRKRLPLTMIYQQLQKEYPNTVFDAATLETIRGVLKENGVDVACGLCFVEDRRQLLGEIGQGFIDALKGKDVKLNDKQKEIVEKIKASGDTYIPNLYELITLDGMKELKREHNEIANAFVAYNSARGMQAGRLFQAYSAYHREILKYNKKKIKSINNAGGLRIFSFSDFEAHHLIDLVQVLTDCASKGIKVQGYTKVPEFARAVKATNMKVNRSLIAKGDGVVDADYVPQQGEAVSPNVINGKRLLLDTIEGIDVNHPDFFDSSSSANVGNILVGINDEHIRQAMLDPFVDYIIPFHTGIKKDILKKKGIDSWQNYKLEQLEHIRKENGKESNADKHGINIYTEVLSDDIQTEKQFVERYLEVCKEKGWLPKFHRFLDKDKDGDFKYTKGYYKLLLDFKLFNKNGRILPQEAVVPIFDNELNGRILEEYAEGERTKMPNTEVYDKVKDALQEEGKIQFSVKDNSEREQEQIVAEAKANGTYLKAPNGEPTNLTPKQWVMVRTKAFKNWFGDWEKASLANYLLGDEFVATLSGNEFVKDGTPLTEKVTQYYVEHYNGKVERVGLGEVLLDKRSVKDSASHGLGKTKSAAFAAVPNIITDGRIIDSQTNWKDRGYDSVTIAAPIRIADENYVGVVVVKKSKEFNRFYLHEVMIQKSLRDGVFQTSLNAGNPSGDIAKVIKNIINANNSSKIIDANGEPKVVYHQTNATEYVNVETGEKWDDLDWRAKMEWDERDDWDEYWKEQNFYTFSRVNARTTNEFDGFFFAPEYDEYHEYGERSIPAFLNIRKPASREDYNIDSSRNNAGQDERLRLQSEGYDGVIREYDGVVDEYIAFEPNQIKSATENVGTFDAGNNDIRFRIIGEKGARNLDAAEEATIRLDNLAVARQMEAEGNTARSIKMATGWERGADGKWRYEVDDVYIVDPREWINKRKLSLADIIGKDDILFTEYPQLREIAIKKSNKNSEGGAYNSVANAITLDMGIVRKAIKILDNIGNYNTTQEEMSKAYEGVVINLNATLVHEIQHAIQGIEGFAKGGSSTTIRPDVDRDKLEKEYAQRTEALNEKIRKYNALTPMQRRLELAVSMRDAIMRERKNIDRFLKSYQLGANGDTRLAGEVEARNAERRMGFTDNVRRKVLIEDTEDVSRKDQIFIYNALSENSTQFRTAPAFYSNAERAVENIKQEKATPEQWLKMIEKNGGLKAGEDKWLGLSDWLKASDKKTLTKQEVLDYIKANEIQIEEVTYADIADVSKEDIYNSEEYAALVDSLTEYGVDEDGNEYPYIDKYRYDDLRSENDDFVDGFTLDYWGETLDVNSPAAAATYLGLSKADKVINETRLGYTTEGLDNKREIALVVPTIERWNESDGIHFGDAGNGRAIAWVRFGETTTPVTETVTKEVKEFQEPYKNVNGNDVYQPIDSNRKDYVVYGKLRTGDYAYVVFINDKGISGHNTLEEARNAMNEYYKEHPQTRVKHQRVLVIDEVQSKRHQEGREKGYSDKRVSQQELYDAQEAAFSQVIDYESALADKYGEDEWASLATAEEMAEYERLRAIDEAATNAYENYDKGVPAAPFEKNWAELAMKRMLRYAAENGFDKVAWTTGEQQAERYNIGSRVDRIVSYTEEDAKTVRIYLNDNEPLNLKVDSEGKILYSNRLTISAEQNLSDVVGKEVAVKIMRGDGEDATIYAGKGKEYAAKELSGDGLRIGGEGMRAFYDQMIPSFMNKYGKKWGVKVGEVTMPNLEENNTMHSVDVTPAMRESVMRGQPMFRVTQDKARFDELQQEYDALDKNDEAALNAWRDKKVAVVKGYLERIAQRFGMKPDIIVFNGADEAQMKDAYNRLVEVYRNSGEIPPSYKDFKAHSLRKEVKATYRKEGDVITFNTSAIDSMLDQYEYAESLFHEDAHHLAYILYSDKELAYIWDDIESQKHHIVELVKEKYSKRSNATKGNEYIAKSIGYIIFEHRPLFMQFVRGHVAVEDVVKKLGMNKRIANFAVEEILNSIKYEYQARRESANDLLGGVGNGSNLRDSEVGVRSDERGKAEGGINRGRRRGRSILDTVSQKGLRGVVSEDALVSFFKGVYNRVDNATRNEIYEYVKRNGNDFWKGTEQYLASLAESDTPLDGGVRDAFVQMLNNNGIEAEGLTDNDIRYMMWRTNQLKDNKGALSVAEDVVMKQKLGVDNAQPTANISFRVADEIESLFKAAVAGDLTGKPISIGRLTSEGKEYLEKISGLRMKDKVDFVLNPSDLAHIYKGHFGNNETDERSIPLDIEDIRGIADVVSSPDRIIYAKENAGEKRKMFFFLKEANNGTYNLLEIYADKKGNLTTKTFYKTKEGVPQRAITLSKSLHTTFETDGATLNDSAKIPQMFELPNIEDENNKPSTSFRVVDNRRSIRDQYDKKVKTNVDSKIKLLRDMAMTSYNFQEAMQDEMLSLKIFQQLLEEAYGVNIPSYLNVYNAENSLSSRNKVEMDRFVKTLYEDMMQEIDKLIKAGATEQEVRDYVVAKSGIERSIEFTVRDYINEQAEATLITEKEANEQREAVSEKLRNNEITPAEADYMRFQINQQRNTKKHDAKAIEGMRKLYEEKRDALRDRLKGGEISFDEWVDESLALAQSYTGKKVTDAAGLTDMAKRMGLEDKDWLSNARKVVKEFEEEYNYKRNKKGQQITKDATNTLWNAINACNNATLKKLYDTGVISKDLYDKLQKQFMFYVPMSGFTEDVAEDVYSYIGNETGAFTPPIKKAGGRLSESDDPFAIIGNKMQSAILQGNRNAMKIKFLNLHRQFPTDLITEGRFWEVKQPDGSWQVEYPEIPSKDASAEVVKATVDEFNERMKRLKESGDARIYRGKANVPYKITHKSHENQHQITVRLMGEPITMFVNGNPQLAKAINGKLGKVPSYFDFNKMLGEYWQKVKRISSATKTSWNPNFIAPNVLRDFETGVGNVFLEYGIKDAGRLIVHFFPALGESFMQTIGFGSKGKIGQHFEEFIRNGGETGYSHIDNIDAWKKKARKRWDRISKLRAIPRLGGLAFEGLGNFISAVNGIFEDATRFAAYRMHRTKGESIVDSIKAAKDISTNFNKKGADGTEGIWGFTARFLRNYKFLFFNPMVQGAYRFGSLAKQNKGRASVLVALPILVGFFNAMWQDLRTDDEDDEKKYLNQNPFTRRTHLMIFTGEGYVKIPLTQILRELYAVGDIAYCLWRDNISKSQAALAIFNTLRSIVNLEGQSSLTGEIDDDYNPIRAFLPQVADPVTDVVFNEDFTGSPIYRDASWDQDKPQYQRVYQGTWQWLINISRKMEEFLVDMEGGRSEALKNYDEGVSSKRSSKWMNAGVWQHLLESTGGGLLTTITDGITSLIDWEDEDARVDRNRIPIARRFYSEPSERTAASSLLRDYYNITNIEQIREKQRYENFKAATEGKADKILKQLQAEENTFLDRVEETKNDVFARAEVVADYHSKEKVAERKRREEEAEALSEEFNKFNESEEGQFYLKTEEIIKAVDKLRREIKKVEDDDLKKQKKADMEAKQRELVELWKANKRK